MTTQEHLLAILAEECAEIAQRASKALRFGLDEIQPEQPLTNAERIMEEFDDLRGVVGMMQDRALLPGSVARRIQAKQEKVGKFLRYSAECGCVDDSANSLIERNRVLCPGF